MTNDVAKAMALQLQARVLDLIEVIEQSSVSLDDYAKRIDRVDDQVYLLQTEIERLNKASNSCDDDNAVVSADADSPDALRSQEQAGGDGATPAASDSKSDSDDKSEQEGFSETKIGKFTITPDMKEGMRDGARAVGEVVRDGKEVMEEITGAMGDLKDVFGFGSGSRRRPR